MKKSAVLFLIGSAVQTCGIVGFPVVAASSQAAIGKPILLVLVGSGLLGVLFQLVKKVEFGEMLKVAVGYAVVAVCTHQLLGFMLYPGLLKDVEFMSPEHGRLTLIVFTLVLIGYLAGFSFIKLARHLLHLDQSVSA
jgi:hypothetical protein